LTQYARGFLIVHNILYILHMFPFYFSSYSHFIFIPTLLNRLAASSIFYSQNTISSRRGAAQSRDDRGCPSSRASLAPSNISRTFIATSSKTSTARAASGHVYLGAPNQLSSSSSRDECPTEFRRMDEVVMEVEEQEEPSDDDEDSQESNALAED
jgi:hypothetical protein